MDIYETNPLQLDKWHHIHTKDTKSERIQATSLALNWFVSLCATQGFGGNVYVCMSLGTVGYCMYNTVRKECET